GRDERIELIVKDAAAERSARKTLQRAHAFNENVRFHRWQTDRIWTRDSGCAFVWPCGADTPVREESDLTAIKWRFNAWAKYPNWKHDEKIGSLMADAAGANEIQAVAGERKVLLEGGSIEVNGQGTLITTEECLLSRVQQRNPGMKKRDYEKIFAEYLGTRNIIWLGSGIVGDDTHGHVDDITRFVSPDTVVTCVDADPKSEN